jgi:ABC-type lipoprotein export system ATPase subunit
MSKPDQASTMARQTAAGSAGAVGSVLLKAEHLCKSYTDGKVTAVADVNLTIHRGEYLAIIGKSGSGKSTLLNLLGALDRPDSGELYFEGQPLSKSADLDRFRSRNLGFVFQSFHLLPILSAVENVQVPMFETDWTARERRKRAMDLLEVVGMTHRATHLPKELSVGERQRVAIARSLANEPIILLADEPTGNLDTTTAMQIFELFERLHAERKMTLVLITHDLDLARRAERVVRMQDGHLKDEVMSAK